MSSFTEPSVLESDDSIIYLGNPNPPPTRPGWTRFVCVSDTHGKTFDVPDGDVLLHSGDLTNLGLLKEFNVTMLWLYALPHKTKIIIAGNHDLSLHQQDDWYQKHGNEFSSQPLQDFEVIRDLVAGQRAKDSGVRYVQDERITFQAKEGGREWSLYGSPWSPEFCDWAFNYSRHDGKKLISTFPKTDILLTHGPPLHIFDATTGGNLAGCRDLANRLPFLRPRIHLFGHIHEGHGAFLHEWAAGAVETPLIQSTEQETEQAASGELYLDDDRLNARTEEYDEPLALSNGGERTAFINAANWPAGKRKKVFNWTTAFGGPGFGPIIVDLKD